MRQIKFLILTLTILLSACVTTNPASGGKMFSLMSENDARRAGEAMARDAIKKIGLYKEKPELEDYYRNLGKSLWQVTEMQKESVQFIMLDEGTFNAWATPGYVNIYRGILPYLNSEAELMAVMSHEAGHLTAKHSIRGQTQATLAGLLVNVGAIAIGAYTGSADAARLGGQLGVGVAKVALGGYSRGYELEADRLAMRYMPRDGYDAREAYNVFKTFEYTYKFDDKVYALFHNGKKPPKSAFYDLLRSHPEPKDRMAQVVKEVGKPDGTVRLPKGTVAATAKNDPQGRRRYLNMIEGISYGPKKDMGVVGDSVFYDTYDRLIWNLPKGMYFQFKENGWEGMNPTSKTRISIHSFHSKAKERAYDAEELIRIKFKGEIKNLERLTVGNRTGYTGHRLVNLADSSNKGYSRIVVFPSGKAKTGDYKTKHFMMVSFVTPHTDPKSTHEFDKKVRESLNHVQFLSEREAKKIEPLRLKIYTVQAGDTLNSIANKMAVGALKKDLLMAINAIDNNTPLIPGMLLKIIIDPNL